ncbi:MAG TPA: hypothetical protein VM103_02420 [Candidatus Paceibacterota bacterium]|nr:hypothetical protein [Candidatus Paceibacterota bacterium]
MIRLARATKYPFPQQGELQVKKLIWIAAFSMAAFLDFAIGTFIAAVVGKVMNVPVTWWHLAIAGVVALSPDMLQIVNSKLTKQEAFGGLHHETWDHWPIPLMFVGGLVGSVCGGGYWAITVFLCLFFHFTHDMEIGNTGGIAFFAPFERDRYFAWWRGFYDPATSAMFRPENQLDPWIRENWLCPSRMSLIELSLGMLALSIAAHLVLGTVVAEALLAAVAAGTIGVWFLAARLNMT